MNVLTLYDDLIKGNRRALAKAITLVESTHPKHKEQATELLNLVANNKKQSLVRIGISGVPGAGKSTFIEAFGNYVVRQGHKVAVLAVDPSSPISGGSILGDKTRMLELAMNENAFIRPSPSSGNLGGVARKTRETIQLCEAAGFDVIFIETVGVGQSEIAVSEMTDFFLILLIAGIGDELQGIKKGIIEMADLILINKADGENKAQAEVTRKDYLNALHYTQPKYTEWRTDVLTISALRKEGIEKVWEKILEFKKTLGDKFYENRKQQETKWLWENVKNEFWDELQNLKETNSQIKEIEKNLSQLSIREATKQILSLYKKEAL